MRIKASSAHEASKQILRVVYTSDYHQSHYIQNRFGFVYVYYSAERCKFTFTTIQIPHSTELLKRFKTAPVMDEVIDIAASKYSFAQIAIGAINARRLMTHREFFAIAKEHFEWMG